MRDARQGRVKDKVVLISGSASGMGASHARALANEGAKVLVTDLEHALGRTVVEEINTRLGSEVASFAPLDVTDFAAWKNAVAYAVERYGKLDALVNNAGVPAHGTAEDISIENWQRTIDINLTGNFYGIKAAVPELKKNATSSIINVSSIAGLAGFKHRVAYSTSKWAIHGLTKTSAMDFGRDGVRVNSIHPGSVNTPMTAALTRGFEQVPQGRAADVDEVSPLIVYLVSDESTYVNGASISIDGGETAGNNMRFMD